MVGGRLSVTRRAVCVVGCRLRYAVHLSPCCVWDHERVDSQAPTYALRLATTPRLPHCATACRHRHRR
eukprot:333158-Chlamydomonas_euryale.AAC.7